LLWGSLVDAALVDVVGVEVVLADAVLDDTVLLDGLAIRSVIVNTGFRVEHVGVPATLLNLLTRRRHCFVVARGLLLEPSGLGGLRIGLGLRGTGLRGRFVGDRLAPVHLLDVCCQLLAHLLGLDVPALVTPVARGEHEPGEHDHRHDCDNDPYGGVIHDSALSMGNTWARR
jgi:hypothetical protein